MPTPAVLHDPEAGVHLKRGFDAMADLLAVTLGPTQGVILSEPMAGSRPEVLNNAATIARRVVALPRRPENAGAMLVRNLVWRMHTRAGDGGAIAAVLAQAILHHAHRYKAAGANVMLLQRGLQRAARVVVNALAQMARPVAEEEDLVRVAQTITGEPDLSLILGELFDILGPDAYVTIEDYMAPYLEREYVEGGRWQGHLASFYYISEAPTRRVMLPECHIALYAETVRAVEEVRPLLELVARTASRRVVLIARAVKEPALSTLVANYRRGTVQAVAVEIQRAEARRRADLEDLAVLTGATLLSPEVGRPLTSITADDLGIARRVEAGVQSLIVAGDPRHAAAVRAQISALRARLEALPDDSKEDETRNELRLRLARLSGHMATLKIGASTKAEQQALRQKAEKGLRVLPLALREGIVPGAGVAYLHCIPPLEQVRATGEEAWGVRILAQALETPFRRIVRNAGVSSPGTVLAEVQRRGPAFGYDALNGRIVNMEAAGILDAAGVLRLALETAVSAATMALTTETIVLKGRPETSLEP